MLIFLNNEFFIYEFVVKNFEYFKLTFLFESIISIKFKDLYFFNFWSC
jgi:hypothetical protein